MAVASQKGGVKAPLSSFLRSLIIYGIEGNLK
jgi:hypothetical protein